MWCRVDKHYSTLKMEAAYFSGISVPIYQTGAWSSVVVKALRY